MKDNENKGCWFGMRHIQAFLIFTNISVIYFGRLNISIALVAMTNAATTNPNFPEYDWNEKHKSYIISSFYWGYVLTQFPGGYLCKRFGAKVVMFVATFISAICSAITPLCVTWGGWQIFCGIRIIQGLFQGVIFPCIHEHLAKWSPPEERNRLGAFSYTGAECGTVLSMSISGLIAASYFGWPGISYVSAIIGFAWCCLWLVLAANNAPDSRFASKEEKRYIESSLQRDEGFHEKKIPVPWRAIAFSVPFNALLTVRCSQGWGFSTIQSQIPSYMNGVLGMSIKKNALFSSLPYLTMWALSYAFMFSSDFILKNNWLTLTTVRKIANTIGMWMPAVLLIAIGYLDEQQKTWAIVLMTLTVGLNSGSTIGSTLNMIELSPNHAGVLMGVINTIANFLPLLTPLVAGAIVTDQHDRTQWQIVFAIAAGIFFVGNSIYIIWGTAVKQPWDEADFVNGKNQEKCEKPSKIEEGKNRSNMNDVIF